MSRRYVFDTNVLVSAVLSAHSVPRQAFNLAFNLKPPCVVVDRLDDKPIH